MHHKKQKEDKLSPEQQLEQKVDAMMDPHAHPAAQPDKPKQASAAASPPTIDIFSDPSTAPEVPKDLAKDMALKVEKPEPAQPSKPSEATAPPAEDNDPLGDEVTDAAVDSILQDESDKVLAAEDAKSQQAPTVEHLSVWQRFKNFTANLWAHKWFRLALVCGVLLLVVGAGAWPTSRYYALNTAGVRSSASITVMDSSTQLPLKNTLVQLGAQQTKTDETGVAHFTEVRLGAQQLVVERVAFAPIRKTIVVGWGSNPLGQMGLKAVGAQYVFTVTDYLSGKPIHAEATSGEANATTDKSGKIVLTVEQPQTDTLEATIKADNYRTEKVTLPVTVTAPQAVRMVTDQPVVYVTKQRGKYDLYKVDVDGKNKQLLVPGTGRERQNISLISSPDGTQAALVSSRGTKRDASGFLLDSLTLIDVKTGATTTLDEAQNIRLLEWASQRLVYVAIGTLLLTATTSMG
jgi:hypothetical protein